MTNRPAVSSEIAREVLSEAGHRCAVCGSSAPLEKAHIIPWSKVKEHKAENLICLCANCHRRADTEKWGEKTLKNYKQNPWVSRNYLFNEQVEFADIQVTIKMEIEEFSEKHQRLLRYALAGFLEINADLVQITKIMQGSVIVHLMIPEKCREILINLYKNKTKGIKDALDVLKVASITDLECELLSGSCEPYTMLNRTNESNKTFAHIKSNLSDAYSNQANGEREDITTYKVVVNHEKQYGIWPESEENPLGWKEVGKTGTKTECFDYVEFKYAEDVWHDMKPLSARKKLQHVSKED